MFKVFACVEVILEEVSRLAEKIPQSFAAYGLSLKPRKPLSFAQGSSSSRTAYPYEMAGRISRQRTPR